jgi:hypothetical protein
MPPLTVALLKLDDRTEALFEIDRAAEAGQAEEEARRRLQQGHYHLVLPLIERAIVLRLQTVGSNAIQTLWAQRTKAYILLGLGRYEESLLIAINAAEAHEAHASLGPNHPDTFSDADSPVWNISEACTR